MAYDNILETSIRLEEVLTDDDDDNQSNSTHDQSHDVFLTRIHTPPLTRSRSPFTVSSRNMLGTSNPTQLFDENRYLNDELNRVETTLNSTRAEKDELSIRYNALSDRLEQSLRAQGIMDISTDITSGEPERRILVQQNIDLRRKLDEENQNYKRKLSNYQEGQQKQAQLVQKLQQKVLQYKKRCSELELSNEQQRNEMDRLRHTTHNASSLLIYEDQDVTATILEEEKQKSSSLVQVNTILREQLDQAHLANQQLTEDVRRLATELQQVREELTKKTRDYKEEERVFNQYYNQKHNLIYDLWRDIVAFRKQFTELKGTTERDLTRVKNDLAQTGRSLTSACFGYLTAAKTAESHGQAAVERERGDRANLDSQIREKTREIADLQQRSQELSQLNEKLRIQLAEKEGTITTLTRVHQTDVSV